MKRITNVSRTLSRGLATKRSRNHPNLDKANWTGLRSPASKSAARVPAPRRPADDTERHQVLSENDARVPSDVSEQAGAQTSPQPSKATQVSTALAEVQSSDLVAPVRIPDDPDGVLDANHPAMAILNNSSLVIQRQIEMMNVFLGFEQANRYVIMNGRGETIGYLAEQDHGIGSAMARQVFRTHRSFTTHIFDTNEREVLRVCL